MELACSLLLAKPLLTRSLSIRSFFIVKTLINNLNNQPTTILLFKFENGTISFIVFNNPSTSNPDLTNCSF